MAGMSTSTAPQASHSVEDKGLGGVFARLKAGRKHGYGIFHIGSWPMLIAGMMMIFSAFLPWVYLSFLQGVAGESFALRGTDGPGVVTLSLGVLALAGGLVPRRMIALLHAAIPGVIVAAIVAMQVYNLVVASVATQWGAFLPGMGLVLAGGGAVLLIRVAWRIWKTWPAPTKS